MDIIQEKLNMDDIYKAINSGLVHYVHVKYLIEKLQQSASIIAEAENALKCLKWESYRNTNDANTMINNVLKNIDKVKDDE
jgi:uncharacterized membrane protein